ncbi:MAG: gfo/Idh/MocA family oxidoreductase [Armatimonadetes bacterium]|nr:gfo/Idh/MocA family oxidoreductase [Armatimonadota bacterium]
MIGIGIIGAGRICGAHATAALALPGTRLVAVADVDETRAAAASQQYGCKGLVGYEALLEEAGVDAVVVALPHFLHEDVTVAALAAGKHVLLEKPMAMTVPECDAMVATAEAAGKTLMVAHSQHFFPHNLVARDVIRNGDLGNLVLATDTWYKGFWEGGKRPEWFLEDSKGGGMWAMNGSHMIDRLCFLLDSKVTAVKARVGNPVFGLSTDMGVAYLDFECGISATIQHLGYRDGVGRFEAEISGTEGQLKLNGDGNARDVWRSRGGAWEALPVTDPELATKPGADAPSPVFGAQMLEFASSLQEGRPPCISMDYARHIVQILTACEESSRTGREVRLGA